MAKKDSDVKDKKKNSYFKEMKAELKKVVWPTPKELLNKTIAVITFVLIIAVIVFVLDFCFDNLNKHGITVLQEKVQSAFKNDNNVEENENVEENSEGDDNATDEISEDEAPSEEIKEESLVEDETSDTHAEDSTESNQ